MYVLAKIIKYLCLVSLFMGSLSFAKTVYVKKISGSAVDSQSAETIFELIGEAVNKVKGHRLVKNRKEAKYVLVPKVMKLGDSYIFKIVKFKGKAVVYSAKMKSATIEDMDTVTLRAVRSVLKEVKPDESATVKDVTVAETTRFTNRYKATRQWRIAFGPAWSNNLGVNGSGTAWGIGYVWGLEPAWDLKLKWGTYVPRDNNEDDARFTDLSVGINYFFNFGKHSPFLTAEVGHVWATASGSANDAFGYSSDTASGWALGAGVGYKFFRTSTVNVGLVAAYYFLADKTDETDEYPSLYSTNIVVYY